MAEQRVRVETSAKRVRAYLGGALVVDTVAPRLVWEVAAYPAYHVPRADVVAELVPTGRRCPSPIGGTAELLTVRTSAAEAVDAAWTQPDAPLPALRDLVRLEWSAMDSWFEEDEEVFVHPRDPYTRVDVLASSRHVQVRVGDEVLADTTRPTILFETGLPPRYYFPRTDVRMELFVATGSRTGCPYKGFARYWSVRVGDDTLADLAWSYPTPLPESQGIAGLVAFYDERVDVVVDGVVQERPRTKLA